MNLLDNENIKDNLAYCLNCPKKPCSSACPLNNDIPKIISLMKTQNYKEAFDVLSKTTVLPSICGRVCPHTKQCQGSCVRGVKSEPVQIGQIEAYLGDMAIKNGWEYNMISTKLSGRKYAVIGSGPSGLTAAAFLARNGASVTIYEKRSKLGGLLRYGIPS